MRGKKIKVELKIVTKSDYQFLYKLLSERDSSINISHKKMPAYKQHIKFVNSKPYSKWYIIYCNNEKSGSIYLSKLDEIGIHLKKDLDNNEIVLKALKLLVEKNPKKRYLVNVNPRNRKLTKILKKIRFKLIQCTYELGGPKFLALKNE